MPQSSTETTSAGSPEPEPHSQPEPEQVNWDYVRVLPDGECVSVDGTHLGHNLPDRSGNRSSARSNASSRLRQSDRRATAEPAAYGSRRPSRSGTAGPTGCRAEPRPRVPHTAALEPLRGAARRAGVAAWDHPGHPLTYVFIYLPTHPLSQATASTWSPWRSMLERAPLAVPELGPCTSQEAR